MNTRVGLILGIGLAMTAVSAMAVPVSFSENWDGYTAGSANRYLSPYVDVWPDLPGVANRYPVETSQKQSAPNSLLVNNVGYGSQYMGITHDLGAPVQATDADPLVLDFYLRIDSAANRDDIDVYVELALDDAAPDASGTAHNALAIAMPFSVRGLTDRRARLFDGLNWVDTALAPTAATWARFTMTVKSGTIDLSISGSSNSGFARNYTGNIDQINIRHIRDNNAGAAWLDDLGLSGGVVIPEPASIALLGLGALVLRRRRSV